MDPETTIGQIWNRIAINTVFRTPDINRGREFTVSHREGEYILVDTSNPNSNPFKINRDSFVELIRQLINLGCNANSPCMIGASQGSGSGQLCLATRWRNGDTRVNNYIVPILEHFNIVGVDHTANQNKVWLI